MERPRYEIEVSSLDRILDVISLLSVLSSIVLTLWYYGSLPDMVPSHFDAEGSADAYRLKPIIWVVPGLAILTYVGLTWLGRYPHRFNYPFEITEGNAKAQYTNAIQMVRWIKVIVLGQLASLVFFQHQVSLGLAGTLPRWWLPVFIFALMGALLFFIGRALRMK